MPPLDDAIYGSFVLGLLTTGTDTGASILLLESVSQSRGRLSYRFNFFSLLAFLRIRS